ncbi:MAG TPA: alpha/beta hydrolase [Spirochaetia bacterium]|nr:alpha/beta hydrolase [Spirochaetia bacterium]
MRLRILVFAALVAFAVFAGCSYLPDSSSLNPADVTVHEHRNYIEVVPSTGVYGSVGLMFIPGGLVDPHAYIHALGLVAEQGSGFAIVIPKEPANLAVLNPSQVTSLTGVVPGVSRWVVGGHSLGGVMACTVVNKNRNLFVGLVLEAAYPAGTDNLSDWGKPVLSISGSLDGLATPADITAARPLLPPTTDYEVISGGIHSYFGSYGLQSGDGSPTISSDAQQSQVAALIGSFLGGL